MVSTYVRSTTTYVALSAKDTASLRTSCCMYATTSLLTPASQSQTAHSSVSSTTIALLSLPSTALEYYYASANLPIAAYCRQTTRENQLSDGVDPNRAEQEDDAIVGFRHTAFSHLVGKNLFWAGEQQSSRQIFFFCHCEDLFQPQQQQQWR